MTAVVPDADNSRTCAVRPSDIPPNDFPSLRDLGGVILGKLKLLVVVPVLAGLSVFGVTSAMSPWYVSVAYLNLDEGGARAADALMHSPRVLDAVIAALGDPQEAREARQISLDRNRRIVVAAGEFQRTSKLFRLEYSDRNPHAAQKINSAFIASWLEATRPPPDVQSKIGEDLDRSEARLNSISMSLDQIQKHAKSLDLGAKDIELAASIRDLLQSNLKDFAAIVALNRSLNGVSRNVVVSEPSLPQEPSWPKKSVTSILTAFAAGMLTLIFVLLRSRRAARTDAWSHPSTDQSRSA